MTSSRPPFSVPEGAVYEHGNPYRGVQWRFKFPNGWGASVVRHDHSYGGREGLYELAVTGKAGEIGYTHPVSKGGVRGWLTVDEVGVLLKEIAS